MKVQKLSDVLQEWYSNNFYRISHEETVKTIALIGEIAIETRNIIQAKSGQEIKADTKQLVGINSTEDH